MTTTETTTANGPPATTFDALIVGNGMVGTALCALLADAGMRVGLVEAQPRPLILDTLGEAPAPRVSALSPVSVRLLEHLGAWPAMAQRRVTPYRHMRVWDADGSGEIAFSADEAGVAALGYIVENNLTTAALNARVLDHLGVTTFYGKRVAALQTSATGRWLKLDDGRTLGAPLVIAADGARSALRDMAEIDVVEDDMHQHAVVTTVRCERPHGATARQAFVNGQPLAFLPLTVAGDERYCSIVWSVAPERARELEAMTPEALGETLGAALEHRLGEVEVCDRAYRLPLVQRHARRYTAPNFALVGDAAHSIHPLAGQGVNLGLMDAAVLAEEVVAAFKRGAPWGDARLLKRFERRRRADNAAMLKLMKGFKTLFDTRHPGVLLARNVGMSSLDRLVPLKRTIMRQATGERGRLPASCR
ncbi:UbiH/UbiF/VisC/COQ6 family ubiquinone biosynthesis hydroxylase [Halomonas garicola]|uniref:UbiH/UbiF/VisC/COQ6 family ubiquinone biosynthesis hydroxylase n=1 Tax=Halomonas garicola TaxID=1690008 RepID=UPI002899A2BB|nr:UbiH/UbiF/VisC/COQ6 family ubiquinone biosynthesis hydroxylase [Halomonas garicola]